MKKGKLTPFCLNISSCYFNTIEDLINIELGCPSYKNNIDKFYYNPFSIDEKTIKYFNNLETLYLYKPEDKYLIDKKIQRYVNWNTINYSKYLEIKEQFQDKQLIFKHIVMLQYEDFYGEMDKLYGKMNDINDIMKRYKFDDNITELGDESISNWSILEEIELPLKLTKIGKYCFYGTDNITKLIIPKTWKFYENKLFRIEKHLISFDIPSSIKIINDTQPQKLISFTIPSNVYSLCDYCFSNCTDLQEIIFHSDKINMGKGCFMNCPQLKHNELIERNNRNQIWLTDEQIKNLEGSCGLKYDNVIFDDEIDCGDEHCSIFEKKLFNKEKIIVLVKTDNGITFGEFVSGKINQTGDCYDIPWVFHNKSFLFTFRNNKYSVIQMGNRPTFALYKDESIELCMFGYYEVEIYKRNEKFYCSIYPFDSPDYKQLDKGLVGKIGDKCCIIDRLIVIQMK